MSEGIAVSSRQRAVARAYGREAILRKDQSRVRSQVLISSIKVEVKKKHPSHGRTFSCFAAHLIEQDLF